MAPDRMMFEAAATVIRSYTMQIKQLDHLNLSVSDLEASRSWYQRIFGFELRESGIYESMPWHILQSGDAMLALYQQPESQLPSKGQRTSAAQLGINHFAVRITDRPAWEATVAEHDIEVDYGGAYRWPHSTSWYIRDPDGYSIEVVLWDDDRIRFAA